MAGFTQKLRSKIVLRIAALATVGIVVSGCTYDVGLGYASDGYGYGGGSGYYDCDPYSPFDSYYDCDNGYGYSNIGYGGGWYDNLWYPGYGFFLFDNYGQRYNMRDSHRRYWGERRHRWYRENRGRHDDRNSFPRRGQGYNDTDTPGTIGWLERNGGRVRNGDDRRGRSVGRRGRDDQWRGNDGKGASAIPVPDSEIVQRSGRRRDDSSGDGRRRDGMGRPDWRGHEGANAAPVTAQSDQSGIRERGRGNGPRGEGRSFRQPSPQPSSGQSETPTYLPAPQPARESSRQEALRQRVSEGGTERPD